MLHLYIVYTFNKMMVLQSLEFLLVILLTLLLLLHLSYNILQIMIEN